jgi:DNA-binding response OmpR family regulator
LSQKARILIIEDEWLVGHDIVEVLASASYQVIGLAADCEGAFELAEQTPPDLAITDFRLASAIDGVTTAQELSRRYGTRVVFVTGHPEQVLRDAGIPDAACGVVQKPFSRDELLVAVRRSLAAADDSSPDHTG